QRQAQQSRDEQAVAEHGRCVPCGQGKWQGPGACITPGPAALDGAVPPARSSARRPRVPATTEHIVLHVDHVNSDYADGLKHCPEENCGTGRERGVSAGNLLASWPARGEDARRTTWPQPEELTVRAVCLLPALVVGLAFDREDNPIVAP